MYRGMPVVGVPVLFCPDLPVTKAPHLCKYVPILSPFQLCGCESMTQGAPHPGAAFNRPWSPLPGEGAPGQSSSLSWSGAGDVLGLLVQCAPWWLLRTLLVQAPVSKSSAGQGSGAQL